MAEGIKRLKAVITIMAVITLLGVVCITIPQKTEAGETPEMMTIIGTVVELELDEQGGVSEALILTDTEGDFLIVKDEEKGNALMQEKNKIVEVTGAVQESDEGEKKIIAHSYTIVGSD